jgi:hypothetical protein
MTNEETTWKICDLEDSYKVIFWTNKGKTKTIRILNVGLLLLSSCINFK